MLGRVAHAVHHEGGVLFKVSLAEHARVDDHDQVTPVLCRELVFDSRADEGASQELDDERQVARFVTAIEGPNGAAVKNIFRLRRCDAVLVLSGAFRKLLARRARLEDAEPAVCARRHVEHHGPFGRGDPHTDRVRAEDGLGTSGRGDEFRRLRHADRDLALIRHLFAVVSERARRRERVARADDAESVLLGLFVRDSRRFRQHQHPLRLLSIDRRRQFRLVRHLHRFRVLRHGEPVRRHLDDALIITAHLGKHEHVQDHLGVLLVVPDSTNRIFRRLSQFIDRHARRARARARSHRARGPRHLSRRDRRGHRARGHRARRRRGGHHDGVRGSYLFVAARVDVCRVSRLPSSSSSSSARPLNVFRLETTPHPPCGDSVGSHDPREMHEIFRNWHRFG